MTRIYSSEPRLFYFYETSCSESNEMGEPSLSFHLCHSCYSWQNLPSCNLDKKVMI